VGKVATAQQIIFSGQEWALGVMHKQCISQCLKTIVANAFLPVISSSEKPLGVMLCQCSPQWLQKHTQISSAIK
jgi:hypothetical protein